MYRQFTKRVRKKRNQKNVEKENKKDEKKQEINLVDFISKQDWSGASAMLEVFLEEEKENEDYDTKSWLGYCYFHFGEYSKAIDIYQRLLKERETNIYHNFIACCYYCLGEFEKAIEEAKEGPDDPLKNRVLIHSFDKLGKENEAMSIRSLIKETDTLGKITLAAIHYRRNHFKDALQLLTPILQEKKDYFAINYYVGMLYYQMEHFETSNDLSKLYLAKNPTSLLGYNLKSVNSYKIANKESAKEEIDKILEVQLAHGYHQKNSLVTHNEAVFQDGNNKLKVFSELLDIVPEAKFNLVIYYLKNDEPEKAFELMKEVDPIRVKDYILKGVCYTFLGQKRKDQEYLVRASKYFEIIGNSETECDTIPGRQAMSCHLMLKKKFDDVVMYLDSIAQFFEKSDAFNWNIGIAKTNIGKFGEALHHFLCISDSNLINTSTYQLYLARCFIYNKKPGKAWEIYLNISENTYLKDLVLLIGNDCYLTGHFFYAAKAFDIMERLDSSVNEYIIAKRGACIGVFQQIVAGKRNAECLGEILTLLSKSNNKESQHVCLMIEGYARNNDFVLPKSFNTKIM